MRAPTEFQYEKLTKEMRVATAGRSQYHSYSLFKERCVSYHKDGYLWDHNQLTSFFSSGLLQHYVGSIMHYHFEGFNSGTAFPFMELKMTLFGSGGAAPLLKPIKRFPRETQEFMGTFIGKIKSLELLLTLGAQYQRMKQFVEQRYSSFLEGSTPSNEELALAEQKRGQFVERKLKEAGLFEAYKLNYKDASFYYDFDEEIEIVQTLIYNWVRYFTEELRVFLKNNKRFSPTLSERFNPSKNPIEKMISNLNEDEKASIRRVVVKVVMHTKGIDPEKQLELKQLLENTSTTKSTAKGKEPSSGEDSVGLGYGTHYS